MPSGTAISNALQRNIDIVNDHLRSFVVAGLALEEILQKKQYLETHKTFESLCKEIWGFSKSRAFQLIESAVVVRDLKSTNGGLSLPEPDNERQARALADAAMDAKTRQTIWSGTVQAAPKDSAGKPRISGTLVTKVARGIKGTKPHAAKNATKDDESPATLPIPERETPRKPERLSLPDFISEFNTAHDELEEVCPLDDFDAYPAMLRKRAEKFEKQNGLKVTA